MPVLNAPENLTYLAQKLQFRDGKVKNSLSSCALSTELSIQSFVNTLSNSVLSIDDLTIDRSDWLPDFTMIFFRLFANHDIMPCERQHSVTSLCKWFMQTIQYFHQLSSQYNTASTWQEEGKDQGGKVGRASPLSHIQRQISTSHSCYILCSMPNLFKPADACGTWHV